MMHFSGIYFRNWFSCLLTVLLAASEFSVLAQSDFESPDLPDAESGPAIYKKMSLSELMALEITTASRVPEKLSQSPSAVQVITGEAVHRSGAMNLADALRLAPNLQVGQINSYGWTISSRGFNALFANKLLVMIDGRSVYTPLDAGVFWDAQNILLEDLDRIEVVSGPGGTLWGANAVNGVINIITKSAKDTQGLYVSGGAGSLLRDFGAVRYGGSAGTNLYYRVYAQRFDRNAMDLQDGSRGVDGVNLSQGGFRMDYYPSEVNTLTLQGDFYGGEYNTRIPTNSTLDGQNILGRWTHAFSEESDLSVQMYVDRTWRRDINSTINDELTTYDLDFQHRFPLGGRQTILWGAGYRLMKDETPTTSFLGFVPEDRNMQLFSGFLQDEITLVPERWKFTIGTKLEHNDFSGFEVQPSVRLAWTPTERQTIWGAISRAVRSPSRIDADYHIPKTPPYFVGGGPDFDSEKVIAYELGYRVQPLRKLSLSLATFFNQYDDVYTVEPRNLAGGFPFTIQNGLEGQSWGVELSGNYQPFERWRLRGGYTYFHKDLWNKPGHSFSEDNIATLGNDPEHQFVLQSMLDLPHRFQFDLTARYIDSLPRPELASYFTFDARLGWQYDEHIELAVVGQNLWQEHHLESPIGEEIPRSVFGTVTVRW